jgi:hypothetical protein
LVHARDLAGPLRPAAEHEVAAHEAGEERVVWSCLRSNRVPLASHILSSMLFFFPFPRLSSGFLAASRTVTRNSV